ncbi:MAG: hypothetical protein NW220_11760 [Leptolyngbyaceae cyanobacterium bins.349]|nr:hypothetical protein [Leptolyngbyaceae cyanobacterium bins.349]
MVIKGQHDQAMTLMCHFRGRYFCFRKTSDLSVEFGECLAIATHLLSDIS